MATHKVFHMAFSKVYPLYLNKVEKKGRSKEELDKIIYWLTGYTKTDLDKQIESNCDVKTFFDDAPAINPNVSLIKGVVCGVRVEEVEDPLMRKVRYLDKLIDELARGKKMEKILRS